MLVVAFNQDAGWMEVREGDWVLILLESGSLLRWDVRRNVVRELMLVWKSMLAIVAASPGNMVSNDQRLVCSQSAVAYFPFSAYLAFVFPFASIFVV